MAYTTALYLRISVDDDNPHESNSIANQRDLLQSFAADDPLISTGEIMIFVDDGWSGANFDRPQIKVLLDLVRRGEINCIVVKDQSRWGRNYPEVSEYLEQIFPFLGIRFISIGDGYDSELYKGQTIPMNVAFSSLLHDLYCKDISEKIKQSVRHKAKSGQFVGGVAPYGYKRSPENKNKLIIDDEAADIVKRIFQMIQSGLATTEIAATLNAEKITSPAAMPRWNRKKPADYQSLIGESGVWSRQTILKIISDERYTGTFVYGKTSTIDPRSRKRVAIPKSEWIRVPNTHDAIISPEEFLQVNEMHKNVNRAVRSKAPNTNTLLSGKNKCGFCGKALRRVYKANPYYYCSGSRLNYDVGCFDGKLFSKDLEGLILTILKNEACKTLDEHAQKRAIDDRLLANRKEKLDTCKKHEAQLRHLEQRSFSLFEDYMSEKISEHEYLSAKSHNAEILSATKSIIAELNNQLSAMSIEENANINDDQHLQSILSSNVLTQELAELIEKVIVYSDERIEIKLSFGDALTQAVSLT